MKIKNISPILRILLLSLCFILVIISYLAIQEGALTPLIDQLAPLPSPSVGGAN